jgi:hypothetical protein
VFPSLHLSIPPEREDFSEFVAFGSESIRTMSPIALGIWDVNAFCWPKAPVQENSGNGSNGQEADLYTKLQDVCFLHGRHFYSHKKLLLYTAVSMDRYTRFSLGEIRNEDPIGIHNNWPNHHSDTNRFCGQSLFRGWLFLVHGSGF